MILTHYDAKTNKTVLAVFQESELRNTKRHVIDGYPGKFDTVDSLLQTISELILGYDTSLAELQEWLDSNYPDLNIKLPPLSVCVERSWGREDNKIKCDLSNECMDYDWVWENGERTHTIYPCCEECSRNYEYKLHLANPHLDLGKRLD